MKVIFIEGEPECPACGSHKFDATMELIGAGQWRLEYLSCYECKAELESTEDLEKFIRGEKWTVTHNL